jgi:hypothetical protein
MAHKRVTLSIATIKRLEIEVGPVNNVIRVEVITPCNDKHFIAMHVVQCLIKNPFSFAFDVNGNIYIRLTRVEDAEILCKKKEVFDSKFVRFYRVEEVLQLPVDDDVAMKEAIFPLHRYLGKYKQDDAGGPMSKRSKKE